ncbi:MAG TPA: PQQ-binding-like beta-propeller repeat protein [Opitutus sp.]|nr:PQQ-binding-like beta-propeller repeat protein [Opitutus sp.]
MQTLRCISASLLIVAACFGQDPAPATAPAPVPAAYEGMWAGELHHGNESADVGFEFSRKPDGRVLAQLWCPNLNVYGSPIAWLKFTDGKVSFSNADTPLTLEHDVLSGILFSPEVTFTARHADQLPAEPAMPDVPAGPAPAWVFRASAALWTTPVVADHTAYLGDSAGKFHAVNTADGKLRWTFDAGTRLFGTAAVTDDAVFFAGDNGRLFKLNRMTGAELWHADIGGADFKRSLPTATATEWDAATAAPIVDGDAVIVGSTDGTVRALDAATGQPRWQIRTGGKTRAAALAVGDRVYVGSFDHFVYALDRHTGAVLWRFDTGSAVTTPPVWANDRIVIGTRDRALLFALDARDGKPAWDLFYWFSWVESAPVLRDGMLYIGSSDSQRIRAIDPRDGRVAWATHVGGWTWGTPLVVGDTIYYATAGTPKYFITERASIGALDRATGRLKWRTPVPLLDSSYVSGIPGSLASADGKILAASIDGTLTAYSIE